MSEFNYGETIDFSAFTEVVNPEKVAKLLEPEMRKAMQHARGQIQRLLPDGATGNLRRSIIDAVTVTPDSVVGRVLIPPPSQAFGYAYYVEHGRSPGKMPPFQPGSSLYKWATRKYTSAKFKETKKVVRKTPQREAAIASMTFLVARAIARRGTKAQHPFARGWQQAYPQVMRIIYNGFYNAISQQ